MAEAIEEAIETAEDAEDTDKLLSLIATCTKKRGSSEEDDWETPTEAALDAYYRLTKGSTAVPNGAIAVIDSCLDEYGEEEAIVEVGLGCLANILAGSLLPIDVDAAIDDVPALVVSLMRAHPTEGTVQEQACLVLEGLAKVAEASSKEGIRGTDGLMEEVSASVGRITNERNKAYPKRVAEALGFELLGVST